MIRPADGPARALSRDRPELTVIVCAYTLERWTVLTQSIRSVLSQSTEVDELILVIDHAPPLLAAARVEFTDRHITIIENSGPRGLSGARNSGVAAATGSIVAFLDDDATASPEWASRLLDWYADASVLGVGGSSVPNWSGSRPGWFPEEFDWVVGCTYRGMPERASAVRNLIGSNMSFRRSLFAEVGGFDPSVGRVGAAPVGCEETVFCIRVGRRFPAGRIWYDPAVRVDHHLPPNRSTWGYFRARCYAEGRSKAIVAALVGSRRGLESERSYVRRTLPMAAKRGIVEGIRTRRLAPFARSAAIVAGVAITGTGYAVGRVAERLGGRLPGTEEALP
jgi:glucosyl-dolichyl phosphate glucuronosyltransferase